MTKDQTVAIMAAYIYAVRTTANPERHRLATLRREAIEEAEKLYQEVKEGDLA